MSKNELDDLREVILESFVLAHLLNHHDVRLDERQRFSLRVPAAS